MSNDRELFAKALVEALAYKYEEELAETEPVELRIVIDVTGTPLCPGHPKICLGSGAFPGFECCCDECDFFLECFPEYLDDYNLT